MTAAVTSTLRGTRAKVLETAREYFKIHGYPPSIRDIGDRLGLNPSTVHYHLRELQKAGWIRRDTSKPRAFRLLNPADGSDT